MKQMPGQQDILHTSRIGMDRQCCAASVSAIAVSIGGAAVVLTENAGTITGQRRIHTIKCTRTSHREPDGVTGVPIRRIGVGAEYFIQCITVSILCGIRVNRSGAVWTAM